MSLVLFEKLEGGIAQITLNDPDNLNAMSEAMAAEFKDLMAQLKSEASTLRVIILTGAGRAFSAGGDLNMLEKKREIDPERNKRIMLEFYDSFLSILGLGVPLIAAINGHAIGAGLCVASACDLRVASDKAKLGFTFTRLGLHPGMGATYFLPRVVGRSAAFELLLTGKLVDAEQAKNLGLVSKIVPTEKVVEEAKVLAKEILECGPEATKQLLQSLRAEPTLLSQALEREADCQKINYASAEFAEGVRATKEKRKANF